MDSFNCFLVSLKVIITRKCWLQLDRYNMKIFLLSFPSACFFVLFLTMKFIVYCLIIFLLMEVLFPLKRKSNNLLFEKVG